MWFIQTPVDALALPTDSVGRTTLTGTVPSWHHLVRDNTYSGDEREAISVMPVRWSIWAWQQIGRRVQLHDTVSMHEPLVEMVRAEPIRACVFAKFPLPGKRLADNTIELIVVVPPDHFDRYEALVRFAMTLPSGHVSITVRSPIAIVDDVLNAERKLIVPGTCAVSEGLEMVVARGQSETLSKADLRAERRSAPMMHSPANLLHDDGDDWLLFAADRQEAPDTLEDSIAQ